MNPDECPCCYGSNVTEYATVRPHSWARVCEDCDAFFGHDAATESLPPLDWQHSGEEMRMLGDMKGSVLK